MKKWLYALIAALFFTQTLDMEEAGANTRTLSPGIEHKQYNTSQQKFNEVIIDVSNPKATVGLGVPSVIGQKNRTSALANARTREGYRIVGAMNASFYDMRTGALSYLVALNNQIINGSYVVDSKQEFMSEPIAFGMTKDGKALIDYYKTEHRLTVDGKTIVVDGVNRQHLTNEMLIYTPQHYAARTGTSKYWEEYIVQLDRPLAETKYGQTVTGTVKNLIEYGEGGNGTIPKDGLVISVHGTKRADVAALTTGKEVTISFGIEPKWMDAAFILGSGPMLVKDGNVHLTIDPNSPRARQRTARSAVAVSKDGTKVQFITVDGAGGSLGMTMPEFARHIASLGYDRALNLDGGGSTTMVTRPYTTNTLSVVNRPKDGAERAVTTILEAVNISPYANTYRLDYKLSSNGAPVLTNTPVTMKVGTFLDTNYHIRYPDGLRLQSKDDRVQTSGLTMIPKKEGIAEIEIYHYNDYVDTIQLPVVHKPKRIQIKGTQRAAVGQQVKYEVTLTDERGKEIQYDPSSVIWHIPSSLGTINSVGTWTVKGKPGAKGELVATVNGVSASIPVTIEGSVLDQLVDIDETYHYAPIVEFLLERQYLKGFDIPNSTKTEFRPLAHISREHAVHILAKVQQWDLSNVAPHPFVDVPKGYVYEKEIAKANELGIIGGKKSSDGTVHFLPKEPLSRAHVAKILVEAYDLQGTSPITFKDVRATDWFAPYIDRFVGSGVSTGYVEERLYKPNDSIQRIHFGKLLYELHAKGILK